jgi:murein DD-endopeptidase MepM/ murein hydrolase activator NlpD
VAAGIPADMNVTVSVGENGFVFPVVGSYSYIDSFYAARATGMHGACDIMAPYGTPVVAFTGGSWSRCDNGLGGIAGYVNGSNRWSAYYGHLQSAIGSGPVSAGQIIGAVGDTGNATGIPHLHIEIWDAGGALINPYPLLRAME